MRARGREIYIITAVVAVVLIVAWYFLLFSPKQRELNDLGQQVDSAQTALTDAKAGGRTARGVQEDGAAVPRRDRAPRARCSPRARASPA